MKSTLLIIICFIAAHPLVAQDEGYGNNIIGFTPVGIYGNDYIDDTFFGVFYERLVSEHLGIAVPIHIGLNNDLIQSGLSFKLYPVGNEGVFKFAIAPTLLFSKAKENDRYYAYDPFGESYVDSDKEYTQFGFMVMPSLNWCINESFTFGGEAGLGILYVNEPSEGEAEPSTTPSAIINFNLGYRF